MADIAAQTSVPVVQIDYRLTLSLRFPIPLHDALAGYDWVVENLLPSSTSAQQDEIAPPPNQHRIAIIGDLIGGSLALSIGLTECRTSPEYPARVVGVATKDAVVDWPSLSLPWFGSGLDGGSKRGDTHGIANAMSITHTDDWEQQSLLTLRDRFFARDKKADVFDSFASPLFFFRTPGVGLDAFRRQRPEANGDYGRSGHHSDERYALDDVDSAGFSEESMNYAEDMQDLSHAPTANLDSSPDEDSVSWDTPLQSVDAQKLRAYYRRHPPVSMGPCVLPSLLLTTSRGSMLQPQNAEFAKLARRAMVRMKMSGAEDEFSDQSTDDGGDGARLKKELLDKFMTETEEEVLLVESGTEGKEEALEGLTKWVKAL